MRAAVIASSVTLLLAACASGTIEQDSPGVVPRASGPAPSVAQTMVHAGSTKAEVVAALGKGNGVAFESGYEVWAYRWLGADRGARSATELVILFGPDGTVRKTRLRPGVAG